MTFTDVVTDVQGMDWIICYLNTAYGGLKPTDLTFKHLDHPED